MKNHTQNELFDLIKTLFGHIPFCYELESYHSNEQYLEDIAALSIFQSRLILLKKELFGNALRLKIQINKYDYFDIINESEQDSSNDKKNMNSYKKSFMEIAQVKSFLKMFYKQFRNIVKSTIQKGHTVLFLEEMYQKHKIPEFDKYIYYYFVGGNIISISEENPYVRDSLIQLFDYNVRIMTQLERLVSNDSKLIKSGMLRCEDPIYGSSNRLCDIVIPQRVVSLIFGNDQENPEILEYAKVYKPTVDLEDIVIKPEIKNRVIALVKGFNEYEKIKKSMGFEKGLIKKNGYIIMLEGLSGTGKTLLAEGLAKYIGKKIMNIDTSSFVYRSMKNERILSSAFNELLLEAKMNDALVFFDECEELFNPWHRSVFLPVLEKFNGIILCATNLSQRFVDDALNRRILFRIHFELPEFNERELIWKKHIPDNAPLEKEVDI